MNFLISGGTGFVGTKLAARLKQEDHHIFILTRSPEAHQNDEHTTFIHTDELTDELPAMEGVINLAGESLFGYWSEKKKKEIIDSRLLMTDKLVKFMSKMPAKPKAFISASAVGYYGTSEDLIYTEETKQAGEDFLAIVAKKWENAAERAVSLDIRTIFVRFGVILGEKGALPMMALPVKLFAGGKIGNGEQWISWIHVDDVVEIIIYCLFHSHMKGPVNATAPQPLRNMDFMKLLARSLKRPFWSTVPSRLFSLAAGEVSQLVLQGQYVLPKKLTEYGYTFQHAALSEALDNIYHT
ncbi:TIGR01777 family oxidoreductase [Virgibacillus halophilus]|uniref:TIGR01777 family oxidoreductase n=1 Tax=Tigheibacillus halophilus TaxID=361280 RepID=A0ABU5C9S3_9BACI|nr:TIGR01777 family oxidoreductase [Virgibacillus halophilus]